MTPEIVSGYRSTLLSDRHNSLPEAQRRRNKEHYVENARTWIEDYFRSMPADERRREIYMAEAKDTLEACRAFARDWG